jgi:hypothetical protein
LANINTLSDTNDSSRGDSRTITDTELDYDNDDRPIGLIIDLAGLLGPDKVEDDASLGR